MPYEFHGADELICDFFAAVERACQEEDVAFEFEAGEIELELENDDDTQVTDRPRAAEHLPFPATARAISLDSIGTRRTRSSARTGREGGARGSRNRHL